MAVNNKITIYIYNWLKISNKANEEYLTLGAANECSPIGNNKRK